jgi:hypothetical protein
MDRARSSRDGLSAPARSESHGAGFTPTRGFSLTHAVGCAYATGMARTRFVAVLLGIFAVSSAQAAVIDCGVGGKAKIFDRTASVGTARVNYRSARVPCIAKGAAGATAQISGTFDILYLDAPGSVQGAFVMPAPWLLNLDGKATFLNTSAPAGPSEAKRVGVKDERLAKFGSRGLGDTSDIDITNPPGPGGVLAILSVQNAADGNTYRTCTRWSAGAGSVIRHEITDGGLGRKLFLDRGVVASCNVIPTTTSTSSSSTTTTSTSTSSTTSTSTSTTSTTSTTIPPPVGTVLQFRTGAAGGLCGATRAGGSTGTLLKTLTCGGLNIGGGDSIVAEGPTPANADTFFNTACAGAACTVTARTAAQTGSNRTCSDTGCLFGPYLPIASGGTSTCVQNSFGSPASGTLSSTLGTFTGSIPLSSLVTLTGNAAQPCPLCMVGGVPGLGAGVCNAAAANPGAACTGINAAGNTYDCNPAGFVFSPFPVNLSPISTGTVSDTGPTFCPGQDPTPPGKNGCFGDDACDYISETGAPAGPMTPGPHSGTLASVFCIPAVGNPVVDGAADLPGPGATSLPGTLTLIP